VKQVFVITLGDLISIAVCALLAFVMLAAALWDQWDKSRRERRQRQRELIEWPAGYVYGEDELGLYFQRQGWGPGTMIRGTGWDLAECRRRAWDPSRWSGWNR
jgi:hypothetical protein